MRTATVIARISNANALTRRLQRRLAQRHARVLADGGGRRFGRWFGAPVLVLETVGRKTGSPRATPVLYLRHESGLVVIAANGGASRTPDWWRNLEAAGRGTVLLDGTRSVVTPRVATGVERERLWLAFRRMYPSLEDYTRRTNRAFPVIVLERARTDGET